MSDGHRMVKALDRKVLRDLSQMRGQVVTIALVVAAGITAYISTFSLYRSLSESQQAYYDRARFADVFARLKRAPNAVLEQVITLPGVAQAEGREVENVLLDMPDLPEPVMGQIVSIPGRAQPLLDQTPPPDGTLGGAGPR